MDPRERHKRLNEQFAKACGLAAEEREAFLAGVAQEDAAMAEELRQLLVYAEETVAGLTRTQVAVRKEEPRASGFETRYCPRCGFLTEEGLTECREDRAALSVAFPGGRLIDGKYRVERRIGGGGMGDVFLVFHTGLERQFALKVMRPEFLSGQAVELFAAEAKALGRLRHEGIVNVSDAGCDPRGLPYLVMELVEGATLDQICKERRHLTPLEAIPLLRALAEVIDFAHGNGVLHCDIKPPNVILPLREGKPDLSAPKMLDFGLAKLMDREAGGPERLAGTPPFMAPELFQGQAASTATDCFAFGVLTYLLLTGEFPFGERSVMEIVAQHSKTVLPPSQGRAGLAEELDEAILRALAVEPERRPASAREYVAEIEGRLRLSVWREWKRTERPRRVRMGAAVGVAATALSLAICALSPVRQWETEVGDLRFRMADAVAPSGRVLVVAIDDASLAANQAPLAARGGEFGEVLDRVMMAGARKVGLDLLLPVQWGAAPSFARFIARHRDKVTLAAVAGPQGVVGPESMQSLAGALLGGQAEQLYGFANVLPDRDGVVRRGGALRPSFAGVLAGSERESYAIDFRRAPEALERLSWKDVAIEVEARPERFRGKTILVGAEYAGAGDLHWVPSREGRREISGLALQALTVETLAGGEPALREVSLLSTIAAALLCVLPLGFVLLCYPVGGIWQGVIPTLLYLSCVAVSLFTRVQMALLPVVGAAALAAGYCLYLRRRVFAPIPERR